MEVEKVLQEFEAQINAPKLEEVLVSEVNRLDTKIDSTANEIVTSLSERIDNVSKQIGPQGPAGKDGTNGINGKDGKDGKDGRDGLDGIDGVDGAEGPKGADGINGKDGKDGVNGKDGSPDTGDQIIEKINESDLKIDAKRIKNLPQASITTYGGGITKDTADTLYAPIGSTGGSGISESLAIAYAVAL